MRKTILPFLFFLPCLLFAQTSHIVIKGTITDVFRKPVAFATVQNTATDDGVNADNKGHYIFRTTLPVILRVLNLGYRTVFRKLIPEPGKDTLKVDFVLMIDSAQLRQVEVTATHEPELLKESGSLLDFDMCNGKLLLLYQHPHGDLIIVNDTGMNKLTTIPLKNHTEKLMRNEHYDIYYSHGDSLHFLEDNPNTNSFNVFSLSEPYYNAIEVVKAYNPPYYYYEHISAWNSGVSYSAYYPDSKEQRTFYSYFDYKVLRQNTEDYQDILKLGLEIASLNTSIVPWNPGGAKNYKSAIQDEGSINNLIALYLHIYSQICVVNDSIYIFNFNNDTFNVYNNHNNLIRKLPMLFDQRKFAISKKQIITDDDKKECYFSYEINGKTFLQKLDLNMGAGINPDYSLRI